MTIPEKRCRLCNGVFAATTEFFYSRKDSPDGLRRECKPCRIEQQSRANLGERYEILITERREREALAKQGLKRCTVCRDIHPATPEFFTRNKTSSDGLFQYCKSCSRVGEARQYHGERYEAFMVKKRKREALAEQGLKQCVICQQIHPSTPEFFRKQLGSPDGLRSNCLPCAQARARRLSKLPAQRTKIQKAGRLWYQRSSSKEIRATNTARRRARKLNLPRDFTVRDWQRCLDYWNHRCAVCNRPVGLWHTLAADHWVPLSKGGPTLPSNMIPLCHPKKDVPAGEPCCNASKFNNMPDAWLSRQFGAKKAREIMARIEAYFDWLKQNP